MAGFTKIYCIGGEGGYMGSDGMNPISMQIWVGDGNRQWMEPHYFSKNLKSLGKVGRYVPAGPDDPNMLLDALILFMPQAFEKCPSFADVKQELAGVEFVDFDLNKMPKQWKQLRIEARAVAKSIVVHEAVLEPIKNI